MKLNFISLLILLSSLLVNNLSTAQKSKKELPKSYIREDAFYIVNGDTKDWTVEISASAIKYISIYPDESFDVPYVTPAMSADGKQKVYRSKSKKHEIEIAITQEICSGESKVVKVGIKKTKYLEFTKMDGCGEFRNDKRINVVWKLFEVDGIRVSPSDFGMELPYVDLHIKDALFSGFGGCNRIRGVLSLDEADQIKFENLTTTKMTCIGTNKESYFMDALKSGVRYEVRENKLYIFDNAGVRAIFKKAT